MIARLWSARTTQEKSQIYLRHFSASVLPALRRFEGYISSTILTRPAAATIEILVITVWESFAPIDAFAGADREAAVVAPEAAALLTEYDRRVRHFEIASMDGVSSAERHSLYETETFSAGPCLMEYEATAGYLRSCFAGFAGVSRTCTSVGFLVL